MRRSTVAMAGVIGVLLLAVGLLWTGVWIQVLDPGPYERTTVTVVDENGTELGSVDARIADAWDERIVGLSRTASLPADEGMLFVHDAEQRHTFVMRKMSFPLDIVFVAENGTITRIHHAPVPSEGTGESGLAKYPGRGKYVLEVNRGWTNETDVSVGDRVRIPGTTTAASNASSGEPVTATSTPSPTETPTGRTATPTCPPTETPTGPTVTAIDANGTELATVSVTIADNDSERYTGLSDTESLGWNEGMLFVFDESGEYTFVMRQMDFPLDIIFVAENGTITRIHHAPVPQGEYEERYPGQGKYVLEVNRGWANETGLDVGDRLRLPALNSS